MHDFDFLPVIISSLNKYKVENMVVGGFAVGYYGYYRQSMTKNSLKPIEKPDLDIWYNPTYQNYYQLLDALEETKIDVTARREEQGVDLKKAFLKYNLEDCTLDLNPSIVAPIRLREAYNRHYTASLGGVLDIAFINVEDLIAEKELMGRPKDLIDVEHLKKIYFPE